MSEYLLVTGLASTVLFVILSFTRIKIATGFRDFAVFIASIILAIASTLVITGRRASSQRLESSSTLTLSGFTA